MQAAVERTNWHASALYQRYQQPAQLQQAQLQQQQQQPPSEQQQQPGMISVSGGIAGAGFSECLPLLTGAVLPASAGLSAPAVLASASMPLPLPLEPPERQGSLVDLLQEILADEDTDGLLLDLTRATAVPQQQPGALSQLPPQQQLMSWMSLRNGTADMQQLQTQVQQHMLQQQQQQQAMQASLQQAEQLQQQRQQQQLQGAVSPSQQQLELQQQQQQQGQDQGLQSRQADADAAVPAAAAAAAGNSGADLDLDLDLNFLENMLQETGGLGSDTKALMDNLTRMCSINVNELPADFLSCGLLPPQQQQQQQVKAETDSPDNAGSGHANNAGSGVAFFQGAAGPSGAAAAANNGEAAAAAASGPRRGMSGQWRGDVWAGLQGKAPSPDASCAASDTAHQAAAAAAGGLNGLTAADGGAAGSKTQCQEQQQQQQHHQLLNGGMLGLAPEGSGTLGLQFAAAAAGKPGLSLPQLTCKTSADQMQALLPSPADDRALGQALDQQQRGFAGLQQQQQQLAAFMAAQQQQQLQLQLAAGAGDAPGRRDHQLMQMQSMDASSSKSGGNSADNGSNGSVTADGDQDSDDEVEQHQGRRAGRRAGKQTKGRKGAAASRRASTSGQAAAAAAAAQGMQQEGSLQQLLMRAGGTTGAQLAAAAGVMSLDASQLDLQQQINTSFGLSGAAGEDGCGLPPASGGDPVQAIPRGQVQLMLSKLQPAALQQLLELQRHQPMLARVVMKRVLQQLQGPNDGPQKSGLATTGSMGAEGAGGSALSGGAVAGSSAQVFKNRNGSRMPDVSGAVSSGQPKRRPLVFYRHRSARTLQASNSRLLSGSFASRGSLDGRGRDPLMQQQSAMLAAAVANVSGANLATAASAPAPLAIPGLMSPNACAAGAATPSAGLCMNAFLASGMAGTVSTMSGGVTGGSGLVDGAESGASGGEEAGDGPTTSQGKSARGLGKRARQATQNDLSGTMDLAAAAAAEQDDATAAAAAATVPAAPQQASSPTTAQQADLGTAGSVPAQMAVDQQAQQPAAAAAAAAMGAGLVPPNTALASGEAAAAPTAAAGGGGGGGGGSLAACVPANSTATGSGGQPSVAGASDAAVVTQQARALVRILTKLNTTQLMQTRSMLQGVLARSAPGLIDHMPAIERMVAQLLSLKQQQQDGQQSTQQQQQQQQPMEVSAPSAAATDCGGLLARQMQQQPMPMLPSFSASQPLPQSLSLLQQQQQLMAAAAMQPALLQQQAKAAFAQQAATMQWQQDASQQQQQLPWDVSAAAAAMSMPLPQLQSPAVLEEPDTQYSLATRRQSGRRTKRRGSLEMSGSGGALNGTRSGSEGAVAVGSRQQQQQAELLMYQQQAMLMSQQQQQLLQQQQQAMLMQMQGMLPNMPVAAAGGGGGGRPPGAADSLMADQQQQQQQQEDALLSWLQADDDEPWPEARDMLTLNG